MYVVYIQNSTKQFWRISIFYAYVACNTSYTYVRIISIMAPSHLHKSQQQRYTQCTVPCALDCCANVMTDKTHTTWRTRFPFFWAHNWKKYTNSSFTFITCTSIQSETGTVYVAAGMPTFWVREKCECEVSIVHKDACMSSCSGNLGNWNRNTILL